MTTSQDPVFIGVDLGGTTLKGALVSSAGGILHEIRIDTEQQSAELLFQQIIEAVHTLRADKNAGSRVAGIGIGIPGLVNRKTHRIELMPNLPLLAEID